MNENINNNNDNNIKAAEETQQSEQDNINPDSTQGNSKNFDARNNDGNKTGNYVRNFFINNSGRLKANGMETATTAGSTRTFIILGWICAALTAFISPLFVIGGIVFGVLANRNVKGSGNALIMTNVVLAVVNLVFGLFFVAIMRRAMFGY